MKRSIIFLIGMFCSIALFAQQHRVPAQKERIYLGENVLIKGDWNLDMAIAETWNIPTCQAIREITMPCRGR